MIDLKANNGITAIAASGTNLYVGGGFTTAAHGDNAPVTVNRITRWDGSDWAALGSGLDGEGVYALAASSSNLYAGGSFTRAGGNPAANIARWDGTIWSPLGSGLDSSVSALLVSGSDLYAAGDFTMAGEIPANHIAKWDGTNWSALGSGLDNYVRGLVAYGNDLYAAGEFTSAGGIPVGYIAKWDGNSWSAFSSGVNADVLALALSGRNLYAAGSFTRAGGQTAHYLAKAILDLPPLVFLTEGDKQGFTNGQFHLTLTGPAGSNALIQASENLQTWTPLATNPLTAGSLQFTDPQATNFTHRYYRAVLQPWLQANGERGGAQSSGSARSIFNQKLPLRLRGVKTCAIKQTVQPVN